MKKIVLKNRCVGIREVIEALNISYGSTQHIVVDVLSMKGVAATLVLKDLIFCKKKRRVDVAKELLINGADEPRFIKSLLLVTRRRFMKMMSKIN